MIHLSSIFQNEFLDIFQVKTSYNVNDKAYIKNTFVSKFF